MKTSLSALALSAVLVLSLVSSAPVFAQDHGGDETEESTEALPGSGSTWDEAQDVTIWSLVAIAAGLVVLGVLYTLKRKVGGFPENPGWVAPITIMPASQLPGDDTDPHGHGHGTGHEAHETHPEPAH